MLKALIIQLKELFMHYLLDLLVPLGCQVEKRRIGAALKKTKSASEATLTSCELIFGHSNEIQAIQVNYPCYTDPLPLQLFTPLRFILSDGYFLPQ